MTNPLLSNKISTESVILWQYDKAYNLIRLIQTWNQFATVSCEYFWNYFGNNIFAIDSADTFGLNIWGNLLGIPRPTIKVPKSGENYDGEINDKTSPIWLTLAISDTSAIEEALEEGYVEYKRDNAKVYLYKLVDGFDIYGYREDGYKVIDNGIIEVEGREEDTDWKVVTIKNTLYRGLLKGRFFMMCHTPTVPNYNKYLSIVFGAKDTVTGDNAVYDIFDSDGNVKNGTETDGEESGYRYQSRCKALDYMNMSMGFTFPTDATVEESYLIFQHFDLVYPFPAGIRFIGEFIKDNLVIGLNKTQEEGQMYKAFVDGLVLADDTSGIYPNGGILSTTNRANYNIGTHED